MCYPTIDEIKTSLDVMDDSMDAIIEEALETAIEVIECEVWCNLCKYETVDVWWVPTQQMIEHKFMLPLDEIDWCECEIMLCLPNICGIVSIWGIPYEWERWVDRQSMSPRWRCLQIRDLPKYCKDVRFKEIEIVVNWWYEKLPSKLFWVIKWIVFGWICSDGSEFPVESYKLWDKRIDYCCSWQSGKTITSITNPVEYLKSFRPPLSIMCFR